MAWADRIRHEMDAYDVMVPKLIGNNDWKGITDYLTHFSRTHKAASLNVRKQKEKLNLDILLFNADFQTMWRTTGGGK